jgi:hypothetical protein
LIFYQFVTDNPNEGGKSGTYSQMGAIDRHIDLSLFQMEEGISLTSFLSDGVLGFQEWRVHNNGS